MKDLLDTNEDTLNIFYTAGYPKLDSTVKIAQQLNRAGVTLIEIGMPYSDPLADGKVIQHSSEIALANGMNLNIMFNQISEISRTTTLSIVLMGYLNQLMSVGVDKFLLQCKQAGVDGLIIPDLPIDIYHKSYKHLFERHGLSISFLITPRTDPERIKDIDKASTGFIYMVADNSITGGEKGSFSSAQEAYFARIRKMNLSSPSLIGFGIKTAEQYTICKEYASGAIIGSEFIRKLSKPDFIDDDNIVKFVASIRNG